MKDATGRAIEMQGFDPRRDMRSNDSGGEPAPNYFGAYPLERRKDLVAGVLGAEAVLAEMTRPLVDTQPIEQGEQ